MAFCNACHANPCACRRTSDHGCSAGSNWIIQHCTAPGCELAIRSAVGEHEAAPVCKWHQAGTAHDGREPELSGMPDVERPWPWQTDEERERRLRMPSNQERFRRHAAYARWVIGTDEPVLA